MCNLVKRRLVSLKPLLELALQRLQIPFDGPELGRSNPVFGATFAGPGNTSCYWGPSTKK